MRDNDLFLGCACGKEVYVSSSETAIKRIRSEHFVFFSLSEKHLNEKIIQNNSQRDEDLKATKNKHLKKEFLL